MKCFKCSEPVLEMVELNECDVICPHCNFIFDIVHAKKMKDDLLKDSYFHMSNEPLAEEMFNYFRSEDLDVRLVKYGISQWIYVGDKGLSIIRDHFIKKRVETEKQLDSIKRILSRVDQHFE